MKLFLAGQVLRINKEREARPPPAPLRSLRGRSGFVSPALGACNRQALLLPDSARPSAAGRFSEPDFPRPPEAAARWGAAAAAAAEPCGCPAGAMHWERALLLRTAKVPGLRGGLRCAGARRGHSHWRRMNRIGERKVSRLG